MIRIGIFGGSFNPVHLGHTALAAAICEQGLVDEVWLMVSPQNPLKQSTHLLDEDMRLAMVRLAVADYPTLQACDFEFRLPRPSYTYHTLQALRAAYPDYTFCLIIGEDNWGNFDRWYRSEEILCETPIIVYPRGEESQAIEHNSESSLALFGLWPESHDSEFIIQDSDFPLLPYSSTEIRALLASGHDASHMLHPSVAEYIHQHNLYKQ